MWDNPGTGRALRSASRAGLCWGRMRKLYTEGWVVTRYLVLLEKVIGLASGLNNYPHRYQSLIPWNLQMLPYMKKRSSRYKMRNHEMGTCFWIIQAGPKCDPKDLYKRRADLTQMEENAKWPRRQRPRWRGHKPRNASSRQKPARGKGRITLALKASGESIALWYLDLGPVTLILDFWLPAP